jgi:hypothetical protein
VKGSQKMKIDKTNGKPPFELVKAATVGGTFENKLYFGIRDVTRRSVSREIRRRIRLDQQKAIASGGLGGCALSRKRETGEWYSTGNGNQLAQLMYLAAVR